MECALDDDIGIGCGAFHFPLKVVHDKVWALCVRGVGRRNKLNVVAKVGEKDDSIIFVFFKRNAVWGNSSDFHYS